VDATDDELAAKYQNTALHTRGPKHVLAPSRALATPSSERPVLPSDQVEVMERDFMTESVAFEGLELEYND